MLPPIAMDMMEGRMLGGDADAAARLEQMRTQAAAHRTRGFFYRLLDVPYGIDMAADEVARFTRAAAVWFAFWSDSAIMLFFGLFWLRYDLWSTWHAMDGIATSLSGAAEPLVAAMHLPPQVAVFAGGLVSFLVRAVAALLPSLVQFRMPYDASRHDAMWMVLWVSIVFDLGTDSVDVRELVPATFNWLLAATRNADAMVWLSLIGLGGLGIIFKREQWPVWATLIVLAISCLGWNQAENIVYWLNVGFWTVFASFAAQSIFFIYLAKSLMLLQKGRYLSAAERPARATR